MSLDQRSYEEKRDFIRVAVECDVDLQHADNGKHFQGCGRNLSACGVLFHTDEPLRPGDRLEMHIESSQARTSVLDASIEVVRVEPAGDGLSYAVGGAIRTIHNE
ncbi:MAG: PilZ domain-containing protein [Gammaproteobacteria bacterium]|nr:MAG: PilZ domain-containing protein [Gammaproteobacteria bacterium]